MSDLDAFLAECDDVIADWEGSADSATWAADGSHEHDTLGNYYAEDGLPWYPGWREDRGVSTPVQYVTYTLTIEDVEDLMRGLRRPLDPRVFEGIDPVEPEVTEETRALLVTTTPRDPMRPPPYLFRNFARLTNGSGT